MKPKFRALALALVASIGCNSATAPVEQEKLNPTPGIPWFEKVTEKAGIDFRHFDAATPRNYIIETFGSGIGWIDYDNDGWLDLFCAQDGPVRPDKHKGPLPTNKFYRNAGGKFVDVTEKVGLARAGFHLGCAVGDYDNDGYDDLAVTYWGGLVLYHNEPDGKGGRKFVDVTQTVGGLTNGHTATSCAWGDLDGDGFLDLYVCNYVEIDLEKHPVCKTFSRGKPIIQQCTPRAFPWIRHKLFHNRNGHKFVDVSDTSGISSSEKGAGLGVVMCDLDGDGKLDIFAVNDLQQAFLFHNQGNLKFIEKAVLHGCGFDGEGNAVAGMGITVGDIDGSGLPSLFATNYQNMANVLFHNKGKMFFHDMGYAAGLGVSCLNRLGFGTMFFDADFDGDLDIAIANGHVERHAKLLFDTPYPQRDQLFLGNGKRFEDVSEKAGVYFAREAHVGRGLALGDYDNDGRPDIAISNNGGGPAVLLRNATINENHFLVLKLRGDGKKSNRNAVGARVEVHAGGVKQTYFLSGGGSYLSANSRRVHIGLGKSQKSEKVVVVWPSQERQVYRDLQADRMWLLEERRDVRQMRDYTKKP